MKHREGSFKGIGDAEIFYQAWEPASSIRAVFVLAHGAAEHSGRYARFGEHFAARGYAVAALDQPGHGRSPGERGHIDSFSEFVTTLDLFREKVSADYAGKPLVLLGHSMGGLIACNYLLQYQEAFAGCILSGPAIDTDLKPGFFQNLFIRFLAAYFPNVGVLQLDASGVSRDPEEVEAYVNDPLNYRGKLSARLVRELFGAMGEVQSRAGEITVPLLLLHGGADSMTSPAGSRLLEERAGSSDKTLNIYPGLYHEIFNEPEREQVFADILVWCESLFSSNRP